MYIYDPENGLKYRDTDAAKMALCEFYSVDLSKFTDDEGNVDLDAADRTGDLLHTRRRRRQACLF